jgi:nicotinate phosphoribosyltransferase
MANGYSAMGKESELATFDLFVRKLPRNRSYLMVAGLEQALHYLANVRFTDEDVDFLRAKPQFLNASEKFWDYLHDFRFRGEVWAMPEGTIAFANEPFMTVEAPIIDAQIAETYLLTCYNHQTKIASKAARCVEAAQNRPVIEFGMRRTDIGAALRAARAAFVGGAMGTSSVIAEALFGIPSFGTHAHSWVMSFDTEEEAFKAYFQVYGDDTLALIDTYDTIQGAERAAKLPGNIKGVRIDSGDLTVLSKDVRSILDAAGKKDGQIFATSDLNEYKIEEMLSDGAEVDIFGVGTELVLSSDAPALGGVYKLSELTRDGISTPKLKLSKDKNTFPGKKQVYRATGKDIMEHDVLGLRGELDGKMEPLLVQMMKDGKLIQEVPQLTEIREYGIKNRSRLPARYRANIADQSFPVQISKELDTLTRETAARVGGVLA